MPNARCPTKKGLIPMRSIKAMMVGVAAVVLATVAPAQAQTAGFKDVPKNHWAAEGVAKLASAGIVKGHPVAKNQKATGKESYNGDKPVTRYELAVTLYRFVLYIERAERQKKGNLKVDAPIDGPQAIRKLIAEGYLPRDTPLAKEGTKVVTANELADAMTRVITRSREKATPVTPDSLRAKPIEKPVDTDT
jgi:hypothetical protein